MIQKNQWTCLAGMLTSSVEDDFSSKWRKRLFGVLLNPTCPISMIVRMLDKLIEAWESWNMIVHMKRAEHHRKVFPSVTHNKKQMHICIGFWDHVSRFTLPKLLDTNLQKLRESVSFNLRSKCSHINENVPNARTERIDRIDMCHTALCNSIVFSKAKLLLVITVHDTLTLLWSALRPQSQFHDPGRCAPARDIMHTVRHGIVPTLRHNLQNLRWNLPLYSVLYNAHWRSSSLVKNLERQWRNGWCLTRRLAISVTSQVPIFFRFQHLM